MVEQKTDTEVVIETIGRLPAELPFDCVSCGKLDGLRVAKRDPRYFVDNRNGVRHTRPLPQDRRGTV